MLSITLTNGLDPTSPNYFAVVLDGGGSTRQTSLAGANTIYDYFGYLDIGTTVFNLGEYATSPVQNGTGKAVSDVSITPPGGGHVGIRVTSEIPSGAKVMVNTYDFTSQGFDLRNAKFFQYMDSDIYSVGDDVLTVSGSIASNNLVLTTIDPATSIRQAQTPGVTSGAGLSGFAADHYPELRSLIESGDFAPPASGQIDTSSIPPGTFPGIGPGYGPEDITTALSYNFTAVSTATISTNLGLRDLTMHRPIIIMPGIGGSFPTLQTSVQFLLEPFLGTTGHDPLALMEEPVFNTYDALINTFQNELGYNRNEDLFFGAYDWRLHIAPDDSVDDGSVSISGLNFSDNNFQYGVEYLAYWIDQARHQWVDVHGNSPETFQVDIIAHSMGGLVTRAFLQSDLYQTSSSEYYNVIHDVVTLGTPNHGAVDAFLELALAQNDVLVLPTELSLTKLPAVLWNAASEVARQRGIAPPDFGSWAPAFYDLLPTFAFVTSGVLGTPPDTDTDYVNPLLPDLNQDTNRFLNAAQGDVTIIGGTGSQTAYTVDYYIGTGALVSKSDGDGTVLSSSAQIDGWNFPSEGHGIPKNGIKHGRLAWDAGIITDIAQRDTEHAGTPYVDGITVPADFQPAEHRTLLGEMRDYIVGFFDPVDFVLQDSQGRRLGYTQADGFLNEFPNAYYSGDGDFEFFVIPVDDMTGDVSIELVGTAGHEYLGQLQYVANDNVNKINLDGTLNEGETRSVALLEPELDGPIVQGLVVSTPTLAVNEGSSNTFTVKLAAQPTSNVTVTVARTAGDTDLRVTGGATLTFTSSDWNTPKTVTIGAAEDADAANGTATITVASTGLPNQTVTANEVDNDMAASKVVFTTQPSNVMAGVSISPAVQVSIVDANGNIVADNTSSVTLAIGTNPGGGVLGGTVTVAAINGVATFNNLSINKAGTGYTLTATDGGLTGATSGSFNVTNYTPDLAIAKMVSNTTIAIAGQAVMYTIQVTNVGTGATPDVVVTDVLPAGTTYVAATAPVGFTINATAAGSSGTVTYFVASLAGGASVTLTLVVQTSPDLANNTVIRNTATVASAAADLNPSDNTAASGATVVRMAGVGVRTSSVNPTQTDLIIGGTSSNDTILVTAGSSGRVAVYMNGTSYGSFAFTGRIVAYGRAGNDRVYVQSACTKPAMLFGGGGNDILYASRGNTVLVGGDGNDTLVAGTGYNILIGGYGTDSLRGTFGNNILIGGRSVYDTHEVALNALLNEWGRDLAYWKRVRHIYNGGPGIPSVGLNGRYYCNRSTLIDDNARDVLMGGRGMDFFFTHSSGSGVYDTTIGLENNVEWLRNY